MLAEIAIASKGTNRGMSGPKTKANKIIIANLISYFLGRNAILFT